MINLIKTEIKFSWNQACQNFFLKLKSIFISAPILQYYSENLETRIETDASNSVVAGVLSQKYIKY
jgi:hypothetical protein